jgi:hypothetical protein
MREKKSSYDDPLAELARQAGNRQKMEAEYRKLLNERENELLTRQIAVGPRSEKYKTARKERDRAESQFDRINAVIRRPVSRLSVPTWAFWLAAMVLAIIETPVNKFLFDVAIGGSNLVSYIVALLAALLVLLLSHIAGVAARQWWSEYRNKVVWKHVVVFLFASFILLSIVVILTVGRAAYGTGLSSSGLGDLFQDLQGRIGALGFFGTIFHAFSDVNALILATINLAIIAAAFLLGYFTHDPDNDYHNAWSVMEKQSKSLGSLEDEYAKARAVVIRRYAPDLTGVSRNHSESNRRIVELKVLLQRPLDGDDRRSIDDLDTLAELAEENDSVDHEPEERKAGTVPFAPRVVKRK